MISYETYKLLHLFFIIVFYICATLIIFNDQKDVKKWTKMTFSIISFLIFVAGMGLIARLHFKHTEPFPLWIRLKIANWLILNGLVFISTKTKKSKILNIIMAFMLIGAFIGIYVAINKPI